MEFETRLKQANGILKLHKERVRIYQKDNKLLLRATLPPRPGSNKTAPSQQWIALGYPANAEGLKMAVAKAKLVSAQLVCGEFSWLPYLKDGAGGAIGDATLTAGDWIEKFERSYFSMRARTAKSETTWKGDYLRVFSKLPTDSPLSAEMLIETVKATPPDTRTRMRFAIAATALAKFAGIPADFKYLQGSYSPSKAAPRNLPEDTLIASVRTEIKRPDWQWAFGILAAYGLRPHELFYLDFDAFPTLFVRDGKTGYRHCRPIYPEWADAWNLGEPKIPTRTGKNNSDLGNRVGYIFRQLKIPFRAYDLRHRWAVRSLEWGYDLSLAAAEMGHSVQLHSELYHHWISQSTHDLAFEKLVSRTDRPRPPL